MKLCNDLSRVLGGVSVFSTPAYVSSIFFDTSELVDGSLNVEVNGYNFSIEVELVDNRYEIWVFSDQLKSSEYEIIKLQRAEICGSTVLQCELSIKA